MGLGLAVGIEVRSRARWSRNGGLRVGASAGGVGIGVLATPSLTGSHFLSRPMADSTLYPAQRPSRSGRLICRSSRRLRAAADYLDNIPLKVIRESHAIANRELQRVIQTHGPAIEARTATHQIGLPHHRPLRGKDAGKGYCGNAGDQRADGAKVRQSP